MFQGWRVGASRQTYHGSRYRTVNIHSAVSTTGTIEFRQGSPTTDYLYIENWILWMYYHNIVVSKDGFFKNLAIHTEVQNTIVKFGRTVSYFYQIEMWLHI